MTQEELNKLRDLSNEIRDYENILMFRIEYPSTCFSIPRLDGTIYAFIRDPELNEKITELVREKLKDKRREFDNIKIVQ